MTLTRTVAAATFCLLFVSADLRAQPPGGAPAPGRPPVSPYVNLLRQGNSPALNYYGLVRPEVSNRQIAVAAQSAAAANQATIGDLLNGGQLAATGAPSQFLNHGTYFLNQGSGGLGVGSSGGRTSFSSGGGSGGPRR